jgi:hypothetical protein
VPFNAIVLSDISWLTGGFYQAEIGDIASLKGNFRNVRLAFNQFGEFSRRRVVLSLQGFTPGAG